MTATLRGLLPLIGTMGFNLGIPFLFSFGLALFGKGAPPETLVVIQLWGLVGGSFTDLQLNRLSEEGWFLQPPSRTEVLARLKEIFQTGCFLAVCPGFVLGMPLIYIPIALPIWNAGLAGITLITLIIFGGVYPAFYVGLVRIALLVLPGQMVRDNVLITRNVIMTCLIIPWTFLVVAPFLKH
jgi:hypothetical protein